MHKRATQGHLIGPKEEAQVVGPGIFNDLAALVPPLRTDSVHTLCASLLAEISDVDSFRNLLLLNPPRS